MKKSMLWIPFSLAILGLIVWLACELTALKNKSNSLSSTNVNLALRRTAHLLLQDAGDITSFIPPIRHIAENTWLIQLEQGFVYDKLPNFLQQSLEVHHINQNYNVAIVACADGTLLLGYNFEDYFQNQNLPCNGRISTADCRHIQVTFLPDAIAHPYLPFIAWTLATALAITLFYFLRKIVIKTNLSPTTKTVETVLTTVGQSQFDFTNQRLICGDTTLHLTYREAKLLHLFIQNTNQVLERSYILEKVWADEGILVGRSLDMFVSRLRKLLRHDASIQLVAIHGVGYKMEVN
jgi:hypothetical protein